MRWQACVLGLAATAATGASNAAQAPAPACRGTIYLPFDTGSQSQADLIASALAQGWENKRIANTLGISAETVKSHVARIFEKIGARNRTEAIHIALRRGLVRLED